MSLDHNRGLKKGRVIRPLFYQYKAIRSDTVQIQKTANLLRELLLSDDSELADYEIRIKQRCCDIKLLEEIYTQYQGKMK